MNTILRRAAFVIERLQSVMGVVGVDPSEGLAVVTGASSGMGRGTARPLAEYGLRAIIAARRLERLEELALRHIDDLTGIGALNT